MKTIRTDCLGSWHKLNIRNSLISELTQFRSSGTRDAAACICSAGAYRNYGIKRLYVNASLICEVGGRMQCQYNYKSAGSSPLKITAVTIRDSAVEIFSLRCGLLGHSQWWKSERYYGDLKCTWAGRRNHRKQGLKLLFFFFLFLIATKFWLATSCGTKNY